MSTPRTFVQLLQDRLGADAAQPLVTSYDETSGERTELSVTTYANWVSKTANLLTDELGLVAGDTVLVELPPHWLVPVFMGAAWASSLAVTTDPSAPHSLVVCGPDRVGGAADPQPDPVAAPEARLASSLLPFAVRFAEPLPEGVLDYGELWPGQSDVFVPADLPSPDTVAWNDAEGSLSQAELLQAAATAAPELGTRLLTDAHPAVDHGVPAFLAPVLAGGSLVLLVHPSEATWDARRDEERATAELRAGDQPPRS